MKKLDEVTFHFIQNGVPSVIWCSSVSVSRVTEGKLKYEKKNRSRNSQVFCKTTIQKIHQKKPVTELFLIKMQISGLELH